jgi:hypothetical protein
MDYGLMSLEVFFFCFLWQWLGMHSNVIYKDRYATPLYQWAKDGVHHHLECSRGVGESEKHDSVLKESFGC